jgi:ASC-1-like (ASCH) protein
MEHEMHLYESAFEKISNGSKTIEIRLNDEKRRKILVGDNVTFTKLPNEDEKLTVKVVELYPYSTFEELYKAFNFSEFGCEGDTMQDLLQRTYKFLREEKIGKFGALGIRISLI